MATSLVGAIVGAGGAFVVLRTTGAFDPATAAPQAIRTSDTVSIESDQSTIISAANRVGPAVVQIVRGAGHRLPASRLGDHLRRSAAGS
jgi:hypothetical protein